MKDEEAYKYFGDIIESADAFARAGDHRHLFMLALCCGVARVIADAPDVQTARERATELVDALVDEFTAGRPPRARVVELPRRRN